MKKVLAILLAVVLLIVLLIVTVFDTEDEELVCVDEPGSSSGSGGGDAVVDGDFAYPTDKDAVTESSPFGPRNGEMHGGFDLAGPRGTPIYAFADGEVVYAADSGVTGFGGWVVLDHTIDGEQIQTVYGHEEPGQVHVKVGDKVKKGQHIADIGSAGYSSGPHLHFEVVKGDRAAGGQKVDPKPWLDKASKPQPRGSSGSSGGRSADVVLIGDSLSVRAEKQLQKDIPGVQINAKVSRQFSQGLEILESEKPQAKTVVMALGTNGTVDQSMVDRAKKAAGNARLILMTVGGPGVQSAKQVNPLVKKNSDSVGIADWEAEVKKHPDYLTSDGVHQSPSGTEAFSRVIADAVKSGGAHSGRSSSSKDGAQPENLGKNPNSGKDVPIGVSNNPDDLDKYQINHIRRIISIGKGRGENEQTIRAAIMAAGQEGGYRMLASKAVPESLKFPNDGVTPGDYDSVGLFAIRTPMNGPVDKAMNAEWQINWFYDTAHTQADVNGEDWEIAANVERPREDLRWKYKNWKSVADKMMETQGDVAPSDDPCAPGANGDGDSGKTPADASEFAKKAIEAARKQMGLPYRWGGGDYNGPTPGQDGGSPGFDCSGLTLYAYSQASGGKIKLPHYTGDTSNPGQLGAPELTDVPMDDVKPGDLVFFGTKQNPHHVGLAIDKDTMIHAPDRGQTVTEAKISSMGDFSGVRRLTEDALREGK